ncbi:tetraacyldisaccharide 4'-kinase [Algicola sagamiensis]|uniref:tetraacyldisaccharide 4'-kinase n=1 Tax=Algicola sagamiensis TaxID=163869 RepID=UPI00037CF347|nr:tetraacyldisaccharide 4'-kinase [Algicola sagamiensis]
MSWVERWWFEQDKRYLIPALILLLPLVPLFWLVTSIRRFGYQRGWFFVAQPPVPLIVVGNLSVGGNGKTPMSIALIEHLKSQGYRPGLVSRGYGGQSENYPLLVTAEVNAKICGDEPKLISLRTDIPVVVGPDRVACCERLVQQGVDVIISDDGLQHYRMGRSIEIVVVDAKRQFGNGFLMPFGPLREGKRRLASVDFVVANGEHPDYEHVMTLEPQPIQSVGKQSNKPLPTAFHAVCAIGHPERFFHTLHQEGVQLIDTHAFSDHHQFSAEDFQPFYDEQVLMTEKDAVKCAAMEIADHLWYLPVDAKLSEDFYAKIDASLQHFNIRQNSHDN